MAKKKYVFGGGQLADHSIRPTWMTLLDVQAGVRREDHSQKVIILWLGRETGEMEDIFLEQQDAVSLLVKLAFKLANQGNRHAQQAWPHLESADKAWRDEGPRPKRKRR